MATCPAGHESATDDYCDTCGAPIGAATAAEAAGAGAPPAPPAAPSSAAPSSGAVPSSAAASSGAVPQPCPSCGEAVSGRFCESCGYDVEKGAPAPPRPVTLVLSADRAHWERMVGEGEPAFPVAVPSLTLELAGDRATLGRIRTGAAVDVDLALTGSAADPAVSHHQCAFENDGGGWRVTDLDSANGTWINDADEPLGEGEWHRLAEGDRILMGAWTCLTVRGVPEMPATPPTADPGAVGSADPSGTSPPGDPSAPGSLAPGSLAPGSSAPGSSAPGPSAPDPS
jgi:hypothetical protein